MALVSYYLLLNALMMSLFLATRRTVFSPLVLPKRPVSVMLSFSCVGNETNITDCIDSEPAFVSLCNNSQSEFIQVTCPGMKALTFHVMLFYWSLFSSPSSCWCIPYE